MMTSMNTGTCRMVASSLLVLLLLCSINTVFSTGLSCPVKCVCRTRRVPKFGQTFFVNCKGRGFTKVPDLSRLKNNGLPKRLDLARNRIRSISQSDFPPGLKIAMLFLQYNENMRLRSDALLNMADSLQFLGLQNINLQFLSPFTFLRGLTRLEKLILSYNSQRDDGVISSNVFKGLGLGSLKELALFNCRVGGMEPDALLGLENLEQLDLTYNWLREIPRAIGSLHNLKKLILRTNSIKTVRYRNFAGVTSLSDLVLDDNVGLTIEQGAFSGVDTTLTTLSMRSCEMDDVPTAGLKSLRKLLNLHISSNPLVDMTSASLDGIYCLQTLDLSKTLVALQPDILAPQKDCLITLFLNERRLSEVPKDFLREFSKLNHVSLNLNKISVLKKDSLRGIKARGYDFFDNPLEKIEPGTFDGIGPHISLGLKRTNITDLSFVLEYKEGTFQHIWLEGNKLVCDCTMYQVMLKGVPWMLEGECNLNGETKVLKDLELKKTLQANCTVDADPKYTVQDNAQESVDKGHNRSDMALSQTSFVVAMAILLTLRQLTFCR